MLCFLARLLADSAQTTNTVKMKKKLKISTLIFGIVVAVIALSNSRSFADAVENVEVIELKTQETEMLEILEQIFESKNIEQNQEKSVKIYNLTNQLVYESRDKDDERLKILLHRSDLVLQTDTSSYYLLGD
jgi:hypothetical protein